MFNAFEIRESLLPSDRIVMCELLVGLPDVNVLDVTDSGGRLRVTAGTCPHGGRRRRTGPLPLVQNTGQRHADAAPAEMADRASGGGSEKGVVRVQLQDRSGSRSEAPVSVGSVVTVTGSLSALFASLGAWLYWGPADGTIDLLFWEWNLAEIHTGWGFGLLTAAAALAFASVAIAMRRRS